jgi:hypothetical protein
MDTEGKEEAVFPFRAGRFANVCLMALSVIRRDAPFCPLSDNSGQSQVLAGDGAGRMAEAKER